MRKLVLLIPVLASFSFALPAMADVPPPDSQGCEMKSAGDACKADDGSDHVCVASKCTKLDYSDGSPPGTIEVDCLLCTGDPPAVNPPADDDDGGCSVQNRAAAGAAGAWAIGALVLFGARRASARRRRS